MIQVKNVVDAIYGLIGWRKDLSDNIDIASSLTVSESGLYYQDAHPLLTLKNLHSIAPDFSNRVWGEYDSHKTYNKGNVVAVYSQQSREDYTLYICLADGTTGQDPTSSSKWAQTDPFSLWLEEKTKASISNVVSRFVYSVMPKGGTKSILEHKLLFNSVGRLADRVTNKGNLVGLEVHPIQAYDACVKLHKIGVQAIDPDDMSAIGRLTVYIKSSNDLFGSVFNEVLRTGNAKTEWVEANVDVNNRDGGQCLYVCYDQKELELNRQMAINRTIDWSKAPCPTCNNVDYQAFMAWSKYLEVWPFYVARQNLIDDSNNMYIFDQQDIIYTNHTNFGLNLEISVYCDYTDFMIRNKGEFITLLMKQLAVDMLREFAYNPNVRANRNSVNVSRTDVIFALDGSSEKLGMIRELDDLYKGINFSMRGLDKVCRPCCNNGLRYTTT
jgi:hypothetical protein